MSAELQTASAEAASSLSDGSRARHSSQLAAPWQHRPDSVAADVAAGVAVGRGGDGGGGLVRGGQ